MGLKKRLPNWQMQARCNEFWRHPQPTVELDWSKNISLDLLPQVEECVLMNHIFVEIAAPAGVAVATTCLSISAVQKLACPDARAATKNDNVLVGQPERVERETTSQEKEADTLECETWPGFGSVLANEFQK